VKISTSWIREFCPFKTREAPREIGVRFSLATAEVEGVEARGEGLEKILAAKVLAVRPLPSGGSGPSGAAGLTVVKIDAGKAGGSPEVVCGAPNVREGLVAPYAPPGSHAGDREIGVATIRGVQSPGMLLSEAELGLSDAADILWELPEGTAPGTSIAKLFPGLADVVLEVDNKSLTHRPDLWGHYGIAREFSVIYGAPLKPYPVPEDLARAPGSAGIRVEIDPEASPDVPPRCSRYCGLRIDGVKIAPSPDWLRHRLFAVGLRPISNVVDVTNYVMLELGQPLHSFDTARIRGGLIRVRRAAPGETIRLLDGSEPELGPEDLVIADGGGAVAIAGVMGGEGSGIDGATNSVFLEAANFNAAGVRRTSLRTVRTDASARFEKSLDPAMTRMAILRAAGMILDLSPGAVVTGDLQDVGAPPRPPIVIDVSPGMIADRLGASVSPKKIHGILAGLGFGVDGGGAPGPAGAGRSGSGSRSAVWRVTVPSWRATKDISIPEDLVEEIGRLHGYGKIKPFAPLWPVEAPEPNEVRLFERRAKRFLALHGGLSEVMTYSMVGAVHCRTFGLDPEVHLKLRNPMSEDLDRMRREIVPAHLEKARENARFFPSFGFFEVGRVYLKEPGRLQEPELPRENVRIAGILAFEKKREENFQELRHIVLALIAHLRAPAVDVKPLEADRSWIHPVVGARVLAGGIDLGRFYRIHPETEARLELTGDVLAFDLDFDALYALPAAERKYRKLPRFPFVTFDMAVVAPERMPAAEIAEVIRRGAGDGLRSLDPFDVYRGQGLPEGTKSIAFHIAVGAADHTLSSAEADGFRDGVIAALNAAGLRLR
jgi:phenylalanyl-tRNA synthetase beta chain